MPANTPSTPGRRAGPREWAGLAVLALPCFLLALDLNLLHMALPHLSADLRPSSSQLLWIIDIYGFMIAGFLITMGTLGDRIGRRKLLLIGATAFTVASLLAAYSTSAEMLIATRALLGIAGATLMPSTLALISNMFHDPRQRAVAISVWMTCFMVGAAVGPVVGGVLLEFFWWGSVFLLAVPIMVLLLVTGPILLPEYREHRQDGERAPRLDLLSVALSLFTVLPVIFGLKEIAKDGLGALPLLAIVAGVCFGAAFVRRQQVLSTPLLDLRLFASRSFSVALVVMLFGTIAFSGVVLFVPQYLQMVEGLSPLRASLWMMPAVAAMTVGTLLAPLVARRVSPGYVMGAGLATASIGYLILTQVSAAGGLGMLVVGSMIAYFGTTPMMTLGTDLVIGSAPQQRAGSASAMSETSMEMGSALGVALLGSVGAAVYRAQVADSVPAGVPAEAAEATRDTLPNALAAAERLPADLARELVEPAQQAFTTGLNTVGGVSALVLAMLTVLTVWALRHVPPSSEQAAVDSAETGDDSLATTAEPG